MKITEESLEEIMEKLENGMSVEEVAEQKYGRVNGNPIRRALFTMGGERGKNILLKELKEKMPIEEIIDMYKSKMPITYIIDELDIKITPEDIFDGIKMYELITGEKIPRNSNIFPNIKRRNDIDKADVIQKYKKGIPKNRIAEDYDCAPSTIKKIVDKYQIDNDTEIEKEHTDNYNTVILPNEIVEKYRQGYTVEQINASYVIGVDKIKMMIKEFIESDEEQGKKLRAEHIANVNSNRGKKRRKQLPTEKIVRLYEKKVPVTEIADHYRVSEDTIRNRIREFKKRISVQKENENLSDKINTVRTNQKEKGEKMDNGRL